MHRVTVRCSMRIQDSVVDSVTLNLPCRGGLSLVWFSNL